MQYARSAVQRRDDHMNLFCIAMWCPRTLRNGKSLQFIYTLTCGDR